MQYLTKENFELVLAAFGAFSSLCGAISHLPLGKFSDAAGELGTDVAGFIKVIRGGK